MPLVANYRLDDGANVEVDLTTDLTATPVDWATDVHRHRRPADRRLTCRSCSWWLYARNGPGYPHFAHYPDMTVACGAARETPEHLRGKATVAHAVRAAGWHAHVEARRTVGPTTVVVDVLAEDPDTGRTVAFEVQVSSLHTEEAHARTGRIAAVGIDEVCWLTVGWTPLWYGDLPWVQLGNDTVTDGAILLGGRVPTTAAWEPTRLGLGEFVALVLGGYLRRWPRYPQATTPVYVWADTDPQVPEATTTVVDMDLYAPIRSATGREVQRRPGSLEHQRSRPRQPQEAQSRVAPGSLAAECARAGWIGPGVAWATASLSADEVSYLETTYGTPLPARYRRTRG